LDPRWGTVFLIAKDAKNAKGAKEKKKKGKEGKRTMGKKAKRKV
jgi:hypothetical protein